MAILVTAENRYLAGNELAASFALRKRVLVDKLGWTLPSGDSELETDQFDTGDVNHLISFTKDGAVRGTLRAVGSLSPNVTCDVLQPDLPALVPRSDHIVEVSRLCVDLSMPPLERAAARADLFVSLAELCGERNWTEIVGVLRRSLLFDFARIGLTIDLLSPLISFGSKADLSAAFKLQIGPEDIRHVKKAFRLETALTHLSAPDDELRASAA